MNTEAELAHETGTAPPFSPDPGISAQWHVRKRARGNRDDGRLDSSQTRSARVQGATLARSGGSSRATVQRADASLRRDASAPLGTRAAHAVGGCERPRFPADDAADAAVASALPAARARVCDRPLGLRVQALSHPTRTHNLSNRRFADAAVGESSPRCRALYPGAHAEERLAILSGTAANGSSAYVSDTR